MVIEQCFLAELGLYRKAAVPAAPLPGSDLVVLYPAFRADALHAGLLADTRSAGSVSLCEAEIISPKGEILSAAQRQMKYPARLAAPQ